MAECIVCHTPFVKNTLNQICCTSACTKIRKKQTISALYYSRKPPTQTFQKRCENCRTTFATRYSFKIFCSRSCKINVREMRERAVRLEKNAAKGTTNLDRLHWWRGNFTPEEVAALRADPLCILPNRTLRAQWRKCHQLGIPRDVSLRAPYRNSKEFERRRAAARTPEYLKAARRRVEFRRRVRSNPERFLAELRLLARGHPYAEDVVVEGYAIMLRDCAPVPEAFKLAKAEVARSSAQPFREQSFDPEIDYEARETGRQVARASDISAARHSA